MKIVVVGNGAAGIFCSSAIKKNFPEYEVSIVYDPDKQHIGVGESVGFNGPDFMRNTLGLTDELEWMRDSRSTFKFGISWQGWDGNDNHVYMNSAPINMSEKVLGQSWLESAYFLYNHNDEHSLYDIWLHCKSKGLTSSVCAHNDVAESYQFLVNNKSPVDASGNWSISPWVGHSYHINANYIRQTVHNKVGKVHGVKEVPVPIKEVVVEGEQIKYLLLDNDEKIFADLFIDCTGFAKLLVSKLPFKFVHDDGYHNNTALVGNYKYKDINEYNSHTVLAAMDYGWRFSISMDNRSGEGYQFNRNIYSNEDQLIAEYERKTGRPGNILRRLTWDPGYYNKAFVGNCIALGLSHGFLDVFDSNNFSATLMFIKRILDYFKKDASTDWKWKDDFNWYVNELVDDIRFRIQCAFFLAPKDNTVYWHEMKLAADKYKTKERLIETIFSDRKKKQVAFQNNSYTQNTYINTAIYYGIPLTLPKWNIDKTTEDLAVNFFNFVRNKSLIQSNAAISSGDFYHNHLFANTNFDKLGYDYIPDAYETYLS